MKAVIDPPAGVIPSAIKTIARPDRTVWEIIHGAAASPFNLGGSGRAGILLLKSCLSCADVIEESSDLLGRISMEGLCVGGDPGLHWLTPGAIEQRCSGAHDCSRRCVRVAENPHIAVERKVREISGA